MPDIFDQIGGTATAGDIFDQVGDAPAGGDIFDQVGAASPPAAPQVASRDPGGATGARNAFMASVGQVIPSLMRAGESRPGRILGAIASGGLTEAARATGMMPKPYGVDPTQFAQQAAQDARIANPYDPDSIGGTVGEAAGSVARYAPAVAAPALGPVLLGMGGAETAGSKYLEIDRRRNQGQQIGQVAAEASALGNAGVEVASEMMGLKFLGKAAKAGKNIARRSFGKAGQQLGAAVAGGAVEEGLANIGQNAVDKATIQAPGENIRVLDNTGRAMIQGALGAGMVAGPVAAVNVPVQRERGRRLEQLRNYRARLQAKGKDTAKVDAALGGLGGGGAGVVLAGGAQVGVGRARSKRLEQLRNYRARLQAKGKDTAKVDAQLAEIEREEAAIDAKDAELSRQQPQARRDVFDEVADDASRRKDAAIVQGENEQVADEQLRELFRRRQEQLYQQQYGPQLQEQAEYDAENRDADIFDQLQPEQSNDAGTNEADRSGSTPRPQDAGGSGVVPVDGGRDLRPAGVPPEREPVRDSAEREQPAVVGDPAAGEGVADARPPAPLAVPDSTRPAAEKRNVEGTTNDPAAAPQLAQQVPPVVEAKGPPTGTKPGDVGAVVKEPWEMTRDEADKGNYDGLLLGRSILNGKAQPLRPLGDYYLERVGSIRLAVLGDGQVFDLDTGIKLAENMKAAKAIIENVGESAYRERQQREAVKYGGFPERTGSHKEAVKQALAAGKPVPPEVLADYPDLARPAAPVRGTGVVSPTASVVQPATVTQPKRAGRTKPQAQNPTATAARDKNGNSLEDLKGTPVPVNEDGTVTVYHRTSPEAAAQIKKSRRFVSKENTGEAFFSTTPQGYATGYGEAVVAVRVPANRVIINDAFENGEVHVTIEPADLKYAKPFDSPPASPAGAPPKKTATPEAPPPVSPSPAASTSPEFSVDPKIDAALRNLRSSISESDAVGQQAFEMLAENESDAGQQTDIDAMADEGDPVAARAREMAIQAKLYWKPKGTREQKQLRGREAFDAKQAERREAVRNPPVVDPFAGERFRLVNRESGSGDQTPPRQPPPASGLPDSITSGIAKAKLGEVVFFAPMIDQGGKLVKTASILRSNGLVPADKANHWTIAAPSKSKGRLSDEQKAAFQAEYTELRNRALKVDGTPKKNAKPEDLKRIEELREIGTRERRLARRDEEINQKKAAQDYDKKTSKQLGFKKGQTVRITGYNNSVGEIGEYVEAYSSGPNGEPRIRVKVKGSVYSFDPQWFSSDSPVGKKSPAARAERAVQEWGSFSVDVIDPLKQKVRDAERAEAEMRIDAARIKATKTKNRLTKKQAMEKYGVGSLEELNARYSERLAAVESAKSELAKAETKLAELAKEKEDASQAWRDVQKSPSNMKGRRGFVALPSLPPIPSQQGQNIELAGETPWEAIRRKVQDEFLPIQRMQRDIAKQGGAITEDSDAYLAQEIYQGRTGEQLREIESDYIQPLLARAKRAGLSVADIDRYLYAKHATERNAYIARINPNMPDGGSGMTNAEAAKVLADVAASGKQADYDYIAQAVYGMLDQTRKLQLDNGLIDQNTYNAWTNTYQNYVPLKTDMESEGLKTGSGFNVRGPESKRATGRGSLADSPLTFAMMQAHEKIIRSEKNRVGKAMLKLVESNPDPDLWAVDEIPTIRTVNQSTGLVQNTIDPRFQFADNVVAVKVDGKVKLIEFKGDVGGRIAASMKRINSTRLNIAIRVIQPAVNVYKALQTSYNPEFIIPNLLRDVQAAGINIAADKTVGMARRMAKGVLPAAKAAFDVIGNLDAKPGSKYHDYMREYLRAGGKVDSFTQDDFDATQKKFTRLLAEVDPNVGRRALMIAKSAGQFIERVNGSMETAARLSAYAEMRAAGASPARAASFAKNLTVNFNRKGEWGSVINTLYVFSNASIQGNARLLKALTTTRRGQAIAAGIVASSFAMGMLLPMLFGKDDEGRDIWDTIPQWERDTNLIIPLGGKRYFKFPLPYGYSALYSIGMNTADAIRGGKTPAAAAMTVTGNVLGAFNPLGSEGTWLQMAAPTIIDPFAQVAENKDWKGDKIVPTQSPFGTPKPESQNFNRRASVFSREMANWLNQASGGDKITPGSVDVSPHIIDHWLGFLTGGTGQFVRRTAELPARLSDGIEPREIPVARRFIGQRSPGQVNMREFYNITRFVEDAKNKAKKYIDTGDIDRGRIFYKKHETSLKTRQTVTAAKERMDKLRDRRDAAEAAGNKQAEKQATEAMEAFAARFNKWYRQKGGEIPAEDD